MVKAIYGFREPPALWQTASDEHSQPEPAVDTSTSSRRVWFYNAEGVYVLGIPAHDLPTAISPADRLEGPKTILFSDNVSQQKSPVYHARATCHGLHRVTNVRLAKACTYCVRQKKIPAYLSGAPFGVSAAEAELLQSPSEH